MLFLLSWIASAEDDNAIPPTLAYRFPEGKSFEVLGDNGYLYMSSGTRIKVYNVTSETKAFNLSHESAPLSYYDTNSLVRDMDIRNNVLVIASSKRVYFLNATNKTNPVLINYWNGSGGYSDVEIREDYTFIAGGNSLIILNISNLSNPALVSSTAMTAGRLSVSSDTNWVYVSGNSELNSNVIEAVNVTNKSNPILAGTFTDSNVNRYISDVAIHSDNVTLFATEYHYGMYSLNVTDKTNITQIGYFGSIIKNLFNYNRIHLYGNLAYISRVSDGYDIINVTDVKNITQVLEVNGFGNVGPGSLYEGISHDGNLTFLSSSTVGVGIYDSGNTFRTKIRALGESMLYGKAFHVIDNYLYFGPSAGPIWVFNISNANPVYQTYIDFYTGFYDLGNNSDTLYALTPRQSGYEGVSAANITVKYSPVKIFENSGWGAQDCGALLVDGDYLYYTSYGLGGRLTTANITDRSTLVNYNQTMYTAYDIEKYGTDLIVFTSDSHIYGMNISNKTNPVIVGSYSGGADSFRKKYLEIDGDTAYAGIEGGCFGSFNLTPLLSRNNIELLNTSCDSGSLVYDVKIKGHRAYVTGSAMKVFDISDPANLSLNWSSTDFLSGVRASDIKGDYWYIGTESTGIDVYQISNGAGDHAPTVTLNSPENTYNTSSTRVAFNCTVSDDFNLTNVTLYGNWIGNWAANETNSSGINNTAYIFNRTIPRGTWKWNCYACDNSSNCAFASSNFTLTTTSAPVNCNCTNCSDCTNKLNNPSCSVVTLTANIINQSGTCINDPVNFTNKIFDCQGHNIIKYTGTHYEAGIYLNNKSNNIIRNCVINDIYGYGIHLQISSNNTLINNTMSNNSWSVYLEFSSNNTVINNSANLNERGIYLKNASNSSILNNTIKSNNYGIYLSYYSNVNNISTNEISNNIVGIYSENSNSTINSNTVCGNINLDFNSSNWLSSSGDNNACENPDGWYDTGTSGCWYICSGLPKICDLNHDGIIVHDSNDLMTAYKCVLGINRNCDNYYQNWKLIKQEYQCFIKNGI